MRKVEHRTRKTKNISIFILFRIESLNGFWFDIKAGVIILAIDDISSEF